MTANFDDGDLGIESFEDVYNRKFGDKGQPESSLESGVRQVARSGARIGETLAGLPGDVREVFNSIAIGIPEYFAGEDLPRWRSAVQGVRTDGMVGGLGFAEPTSSELREDVSQKLGGEYLEPQSKWESFGDEVAQDFAALAIPIKGKVPFARALGSSIIANTGGEVAKAFGGDTAQAATKMGLLFAGSLLAPRGEGIKKHIRKLYSDMESSVSPNATVSAKDLSSKLNKIEAVLRKGDPSDTSKVEVFKKIGAIRDKISSGQINVDEVLALTNSTNESIFGIGELKRGQNQLYKVREALHDATKQYGSSNKEFLGKWKDANQAYAATEMSRKLGNMIRKNVKPRDYVHAAAALGAEGVLAGAPMLAGTVIGGAGIGATVYAAEALKRSAQSPALRKYYLNVISNAFRENEVGFIRSLKQLDKGLKESFEKDPIETVEFD